MKRLINIVFCLGINGKPFRGNTEKSNNINIYIGLFLGVIRFLRKYDTVIGKYFVSGFQNALYTSNCIQNTI